MYKYYGVSSGAKDGNRDLAPHNMHISNDLPLLLIDMHQIYNHHNAHINHDELVGLDCIGVTACMKNTVGLYALNPSPTNAVIVNKISKLHGCIYPWEGGGIYSESWTQI